MMLVTRGRVVDVAQRIELPSYIDVPLYVETEAVTWIVVEFYDPRTEQKRLVPFRVRETQPWRIGAPVRLRMNMRLPRFLRRWVLDL